MAAAAAGTVAETTRSALRSLARRGAGRDERPAPARNDGAGAEVGRLFEAQGRMVFALCNLLLRHRQEAEDATQQAFLSAHRSLLAGTDPEDPAAWIAAIARNECFTRLRRRRPETVPLFDADRPADRDLADLVDQHAEIAALSQAIAGLPPAQRQAVVLRDFYGLSYKEVSVALDLSGPAVEPLLFKSRKRLQERLRPLRASSGFATLPATCFISTRRRSRAESFRRKWRLWWPTCCRTPRRASRAWAKRGRCCCRSARCRG